MATNFPTSLDNFTRLVDNYDTILSAHINNVQDAIEALQAKVGVDNDTLDTMDYKLVNFFDSSAPRKMYFYENTPPTNWVVQGSVGDYVLGVKGGSYFTTGGAVYDGGWAISGWQNDAHTHAWFYLDGTETYSYNSGGSAVAMTTEGASGKGIWGILIDAFSDACIGSWYLCDVEDFTFAYVGLDTHTHTHGGTWRPPGAIGIIAYYNG
jgi:hypothetical protein